MLVIARYLVAAVFFSACLVALVHWGIRRKRLNAFGSLARFTRSVSDPLLKPVERKVIRFGGNPQDAPIWLIGIVVVAGLLLLSLIQWLVNAVLYVSLLAHGGSRAWASMIVSVLYFIVTTALLLRVVGSWIGIDRHNRWMRYAYRLTDWIVEPIRRMLPASGFIDISPLVAWLALWIIRTLIARFFFV
ncbi:MAG: YggT family protein [Gemmatimonadota bacterium]